MSEQLYRVCWKRKQSPQDIHHGELANKATCDAWVKKLNREHPDLHHWVEAVN